MLRDSNVSVARPSTAMRFLAVGAVLLCAIFIAGLRGQVALCNLGPGYLECGDLSPFLGAGDVRSIPRTAERKESGDKSPQSK